MLELIFVKLLNIFIRIRLGGKVTFGRDVIFRRNPWIEPITNYSGSSYSPKIVISDRVRIGANFVCTAIENVHIGESCLISEGVMVTDHVHGTEQNGVPYRLQSLVGSGGIRIEKNVFIGAGTHIIGGGIEVGENSVIGAGSLVTKSIPPGVFAAGRPARVRRSLS